MKLAILLLLTVNVFGQSAPPCPSVDVEGKCSIAGPLKPGESTAPKPPDAIIAAYFKADAAVGATRAQHDAQFPPCLILPNEDKLMLNFLFWLFFGDGSLVVPHAPIHTNLRRR